MTRRNYVLSDAAETDLREIIRYTRKHWGDTQVRRYIHGLEQRIARLVTGQMPFQDMSELYPALRSSLRVLPATRTRTHAGRRDFA